jgi:FkbM family methyltransferase
MMKQVILNLLRRNGYDIVRRAPAQPGAASAHPVIHYPPTAWLDAHPIRTILDIGANAGDFALTMAGRFPGARILSFEPLAGPYAELARKTAGEPRCTAIRCAVGEADSTIEMRPCTYSPSSSLLPMTDVHREAFPFTAGEGSPEVIRVRRLDDIAAETDLEDEMLVKIDVQGFEGHVIRGGMATLRRARGIIVETSFVPLYDGQPSFDDVYRALCGLGFVYAGNWDQLPDAKTGRVLQADAIFLRSA